jgi:hypothetical protein
MGAPSAVSCIDARSLSYWLCAARGRTFAQNQVWCEIAALAGDLTARMQLIALTGPANRWEPKKLRFRLHAIAGRIVRGGRRLRLQFDARWRRAPQVITALAGWPALTPANLLRPAAAA